MTSRSLRLRTAFLVVPLCGALLFTTFASNSASQEPPKSPPEGRGDAPQGGPERPRGPRGERGAPNLHNSMEQLGRMMEQVQGTIGDAAKAEETLTGLGRMVQFAGGSVAAIPKSIEEQPEEKRVAFKNAFRREMLMMTRQLVDIELLVLDGKNSEAAEAFKKLAAARDAAHDKFGGNEEEHKEGGEKPQPPKK